MNKHPNFVKNTLCSIIASMAQNVENFVREPGKDFSRRRTFDFETLIQFVLSLGGNTLATEITNFFSYEAFPSASAFVQQRQKVLPEAFRHLLGEFNRRIDAPPKLFHGYQLLAADGSVLTLPYNPSEMQNVRTTDHYNFLHLSTLYDLCSKRYVDAEVCSGTKTAEAQAAAIMVDRLPDRYPVIFLADRGYESYNLFAHVEEHLFDYIIRIKDADSNGILSGCTLPDSEVFDTTKELVITRHSTGPAAVNPQKYKYVTKTSGFDYLPDLQTPDYELSTRFVRFQLKDGSYVTLATSLSEQDFPPEVLAEIYHMRWGIETSYREVKHSLGMVYWHSKKAACITQEVYAHLIMYNFSMYIAADLKPEQQRSKYPMQINFTQAFKICMDFFRLKGNARPPNVEMTILKFVLPVRDGRSFPRKTVSPSVVSFNYRVS